MNSKGIPKHYFWIISLITTLCYGVIFQFSMNELISVKGVDSLGYISLSRDIGFVVIIIVGILIHVTLLFICRWGFKRRNINLSELVFKNDSWIVKLANCLGYMLILLKTYNYFISPASLHLFTTLYLLMGIIEVLFALVWIGNIFNKNQINDKILMIALVVLMILIVPKYIPLF